MSFDFNTLITDRSQTDVSEFYTLLEKPLDSWTPEELNAFNSGLLKGGYFWTDLNRVTACMEYLDAELRKLGYNSGYEPVAVDFSNRYEWNKEDNPTIGQINRYLENVLKISSTLAEIPGNTQRPTSLSNLSFSTANNIEKILFNINTMLENMKRTVDLGWAIGIAHIGLYGGV